jgi:hypothetical protein
MSNKVITAEWDHIERVDVSPILKLVKLEMKDPYRRDPLMDSNVFKINEIRFLMTKEEREMIKGNLPHREIVIF